MRTTPFRALTALALALAIAACAAPPPADTTAEDMAAVNALRDAWTAAYNAADVDALAALYTADAIDAVNETPNLVGQAAIRDHYAAQFGAMTASASVTADETRISGDLAFDRGTFQVTITPTDGEAIQRTGRYIVILQRDASGWKIARGIDNTPTPPPDMGGGQ